MHLDGCVEVEAAYYGLPPGWVGRRVPVRRAGSHIGTLCEHIRRRQGEAAVRRILGVLSLAKKYGVAAVEDAAPAALLFFIWPRPDSQPTGTTQLEATAPPGEAIPVETIEAGEGEVADVSDAPVRTEDAPDARNELPESSSEGQGDVLPVTDIAASPAGEENPSDVLRSAEPFSDGGDAVVNVPALTPDEQRLSDIREIQAALEQYFSRCGEYPTGTARRIASLTLQSDCQGWEASPNAAATTYLSDLFNPVPAATGCTEAAKRYCQMLWIGDRRGT